MKAANFYKLVFVTLLLIAGCGGDSISFVDARPVVEPAAGPVRISADWLRQQPGESFGEFSFHLLDADWNALTQWPGVTVAEDRVDDYVTFSLIAEAGAVDDLYLYTVYSGDRWELAEARLATGRDCEYVLLAIPERIEDVLAVGLARIGAKRGSSLAAGPLMHLRFIPGQTSVNKAASAVNDDPRSVADLSAVGGGDFYAADISWRERNIGDYNNNGLVEVADLTPIGIYYEQAVAAADDPELLEVVDGNLDGFVTIHDITPIGQNFNTRIDGFRLYVAFTANPQPADFRLYPISGYATYTRSSAYDVADDLAKKKRLVYSQTELPVEDPSMVWLGGEVSFQVRAYADDGGAITEGPPSNSVDLNYSGLPGPPLWTNPINAAGITDTWGDVQDGNPGVWVEFGDAYDPDGDDVYYRIYYYDAAGPFPVDPSVLQLREDSLEAGPLYQVFIHELIGEFTAKAGEGPLVRGTDYMFYVTAADGPDDESQETTTNNGQLSAHPPALSESAEPWSHYRGNAQRTGSNPACTLADPVEWDMLYDLFGGSPLEFSQTLISDTGWALTAAAGAAPRQVDVANGNAEIRGTLTMTDRFYSALTDERILIGNGSQLQSMDHDGDDRRQIDINSGAALLALGDLIYVVSQGGDIDCLTADRLLEQWSHDLDLAQPPDTILAPVADAEYLYYAVDQMLYKYDLLTGESAGQGTLPFPPVGDSMALDQANQHLYVSINSAAAVDNSVLIEYNTAELTESQRFPTAAYYRATSSPCLALHTDPPVVYVAAQKTEGELQNTLTACDPATGFARWQRYLGDHHISEISCSADRIFLIADAGRIVVLDLNGNIRQDSATSVLNTEIALSSDLGIVAGADLDILVSDDPDPPPFYIGSGDGGIETLVVGDGEIDIEWYNEVVDSHDETINFAIFYSTEWPVEFDEPRAHTTVIPGIPVSTDSLTIEWLENGTRYWVGVRAYDGVWGVDENMEQNTVMLVGTPPWQREEIVFHTFEPNFMRGLVDPAGGMHLVFNAAADGSLYHIWGSAGNWEYEPVVDSILWNPVVAQGFEPAWDPTGDRLAIAYANWPLKDIGYLLRLTDDYSQTVFGDTSPTINPQVSMALGSEAALAYTQDIIDMGIEYHVDYYLKRTNSSIWQGYEPLEETNLSGRDLDLVLDPADGESPWLALQRGGESDPNRYTPQEGECMYARWDSGSSSWDYVTVDAGENAPDSDCGKRVQQALDDDGNPHLAYLDLNSSASEPFGQLKYAYYDGSAWHVEVVSGFDLSFQTGNLQFTWGELGIALVDDGEGGQEPVIAQLDRRSGSEPGEPHQSITEVWVREGADDWRLERLTDAELSFPRDREPCVLLVTPDGVWHVFYVTASDQELWEGSDMLVHLWRPVS